MELYSLLKSLSKVLQASQPSQTPSVPTAMQRAVLLLASDLACKVPLELFAPRHFFSASDAGAISEGTPPGGDRRTKHPDELTAVGKQTRRLLRDEVFRRFGLDRWGRNFEQESHLFDMTLALHPGCRQLQYMDKLSDNAPEVFRVKAKVFAQIQNLVENVIVHERSMAQMRRQAPEDAQASAGQPGVDAGEGSKKARVSPPANHDMVNAMAKAGLFDTQVTMDSDGEWEKDSTPAEEAEEAVKTWRTAKVGDFVTHGNGSVP